MIRLLAAVAPCGRWCLVLGLLAGLALPGMAAAFRPWLPQMIAALLFLAALRIGPRAAFGSLHHTRRTLTIALLYQLALSLVAVAALTAFGIAGAVWAVALTLVLAAPPVTGSPHFAILMGRDPDAAMRLLLIGTAIFPATVLPILWLSPAVETLAGVILAALRLLAVIALAVGAAFWIRHRHWREPVPRDRAALDGAAAILLGVVVVGLMSAIGPALRTDPVEVALWLAFACVVNFGLQLAAARLVPVWDETDRPGTALVAGNRNIALFLVALPPETTDALLLFIGAYQVPMYLTPMLMRRLTAPRV